MSQPALVIEQDNDTVVSQIGTSIPSQPTKSVPLRDSVRAAVRDYFVELDSATPTNLYELFMAEIESPLLEMVLQYTGQNQSTAAKLLKLSRGTLRKKMAQYGFLDPQGKRHRRNIGHVEG